MSGIIRVRLSTMLLVLGVVIWLGLLRIRRREVGMLKRKVEVYKVRIVGERPLLMHKIPENLGEKSRSGEKVDPREEAEKYLYRDDEGKICVPALNVKASIREAAKDYKVPGKGRKTFKDYVKAGIIVEPEMIPLKTPNGDPEKAWKVDIRPVVVQRSRIMRARPRFDQWELEFYVKILDPIITPEDLKKFIEDAGRFKGLCDFRPEFGLFSVAEFRKVDKCEAS